MLSSLFDIQHGYFQKRIVMTFNQTPGVEGVCKGRIYECIVLYAPFHLIIPRRSRRDIVLASSVRPFRPSVCTFCLSGTISQYLLVRFNSFLVQMISTMDSQYPISLVKIDPLTFELLPLFKYRHL